jgi:hypothetical protein
MLGRVIPSIARSCAVLAGAACLVLAGCGTQVYVPQATATHAAAPDSSHASTASPAPSLSSLESERSQVAGRYWPATSLVMKAVPGMEARLGLRLRFEEALGTFTSCDTRAGGGLQYQVAVIIEASGHTDEDLGWPLGQAARIAEQALTAAGWGPFRVSQGVWVAAEHDGVSASFDNDPAATESSETSMVTDLLYFLAGECVAVPGPASIPPGGGSQAGGGPDAGPPPGDASAGDGLPPVRDSYGLGPAAVAPLA